jgi:hypothetical protein
MRFQRRQFIKSFGIGMASFVMARCIPFKIVDDSPRDRLLNCWQSLDKLAQKTQEDYEWARQLKESLISDHRTALDDLVASGEISSATAEQVQIAFQEATYHVWRSNAPITCYEPVLVDYTPTSSEQLTQKVALLEEIAGRSDIDENTLAQAQAAIERDITFLGLTDEETQSLYDELIAAAGDTYNFPSFDELNLEITHEAMEAARFLVELFMEDER